MQLTLNKQTALYLLRLQRASRGKRGLRRDRIDLLEPDPSPGKRWTRRLLDPSSWELGVHAGAFEKIDVCVGNSAARLKSRFASNTIYGSSIPQRSFMRLNRSVAISRPELLFTELAPLMGLREHLQLGFELCGCFSRDASDPVGGDVIMDIPAATSVTDITRYLDSANLLAGTKKARHTLKLLSDNAWSPTESVIATVMALPLEEYGYGFGRCMLNPRVPTPEHLVGTTDKESRVPDIMVEGTSVGLNYDGTGHLDLDAIAQAGVGLGQDLGSSQRERELDDALRRIRAKALDDIRRNRELAADGLTVFQVYKEDVYEYGGLDKVMMQVLTALEMREGWDVSGQMELLRSSFARRERQALVYSMMPGGWRVPPSNEEHAFVKL